MTDLVRVPVRLAGGSDNAAGGSYEVIVGPGARHELSAVLSAVLPGVRRVAIVTQEPVGVEVDTGLEQETVVIPGGESAKTLSTIEEVCRRFTRFSLTRGDVVVAVGGGVVTDVAGFAASVYHRGVAFANVATTLLAQVDAAIGGKTGVNLPEGKNLVGSFWQPCVVLCDTDVLGTLPPGEMRSGLGEVAKYAFLGAPGLEKLPLPEQVARCVALKAAVVAEDERETSGRRAVLNYGHTLAHALEADALDRTATGATAGVAAAGPGTGEAGAPTIRHGEAVAIGLVFAARLAHRLGRIDAERVEEHNQVVKAYGLPITLPPASDPGKLVSLMAGDKKAMFAGAAGGLTFVLDGPSGVELVRGIDPAVVVETLGEMERG